MPRDGWDTWYIRGRRRRQSSRRRVTCTISTKLYRSEVRGLSACTRQKQPQWPTRNTSIPSRLTLGLTYRQRNIWRSNIFPRPLGWWHFPATRSTSPLNSFSHRQIAKSKIVLFDVKYRRNYLLLWFVVYFYIHIYNNRTDDFLSNDFSLLFIFIS